MADYRLSITGYQYNNLCDTYGCNNRAKHSLGREGYPKRAAHNLCEQCLEDIAMQVPLDIILKREDLQDQIGEFAEDSAEEITPLNEDIPPDDDIPIGDLPFTDDFEGELIDSYSYKELQDIAKELGLPSVGIKTQALKDSILVALKDG